SLPCGSDAPSASARTTSTTTSRAASSTLAEQRPDRALNVRGPIRCHCRWADRLCPSTGRPRRHPGFSNGWVKRGFCHQEAPQAHGEEEAPQAVEEDARATSSSRQVGTPL